MNDDEKADIARGGLALLDKAESLSPEALRARLGEAAADGAKNAVLSGVRALSDLTGTSVAGMAPKRPRVGPSAEAVERTLEALEAASAAEFDARLSEAATRAQERAVEADQDIDAMEAAALARLRRSFPSASKELAILLFACVDLLEDLAEIDTPPSPAELAKKELLIARIGALLAPRAETALSSFVGHVVALSRERRER